MPQKSSPRTCPWGRICAAWTCSSSTTQLAAMLFGSPVHWSFHLEVQAMYQQIWINDNNCAFPADLPWNSIEVKCSNLLLLHPETLCTTEKATGPNRCVQTRKRHQTKLQRWNEGNELCRNAGKRTGKAVWLGTDTENIQAGDLGKFIQISSDYLLSVTKYEAPANAIEQKSTKQKSCFIQSPGITGLV